MKLYTYWRSTAAYRVRIALALKGIELEQVPVHLVRGGGEQRSAAFRAINPQMRVPALELDGHEILTQSIAIIEYLEEVCLTPQLLPADPIARAKIRAVAATIACDIHPFHNIGTLNDLRRDFGASDTAVSAWIGTWIARGFQAVEQLLGDRGFSFGDQPGMADVCLIPQIYAARRFEVPLLVYPKILRVEERAQNHAAFMQAHPSRQRDAE